MKKYFLALGLVIIQSGLISAQELKHLKYGVNEVGFKSILVKDYSRPSRQPLQSGRALQINAWYPARAKAGSSMNFATYISLKASEDNIANPVNDNTSAINSYLDEMAGWGSDIASWKVFLDKKIPMKAKKNASFLPGHYPVVLLMHGGAADYSFLGEFLASHGMIAVNVPYKGYLQNKFDVNVIGMETEIRDHEYAFDYIVKELKLNPKKIGIVGHSFGAQSAVGLGVRNKMVKGIVSLDGGIGSAFGPQLLSGHPFYNIEKVNMPLLHLYNPADKEGNTDWFNDCVYADRLLVPFKNMDHSFFAAFGLLDNYVNKVIGPSKPKAGNNYEVILAFTLKFFDRVFSNEPPGIASIKDLPVNHPWMAGSIEPTHFRKKEFTPVPLEELQNAISEKGIKGLKELHQKHKAIWGLPITDNSYRTLFLTVFSELDKPAMAGIAELYETDFPRSALAKYFRGRALQENEQPTAAKDYFKQCLELISADKSLTPGEKEAYTSRCQLYLKS